jgi:hypothetical protein
MAAWIALFISLVSLILMIVILIRFKKLFSTDAIIEKTKAQMNRVIKDVNGNANRDLELINESSRRLRALLNEADKKMESFREASQLLRNLIAEAEKKSGSGAGKVVYVESVKEPVQKKSEEKPKVKNNPYVDPDASYRVRTVPPAAGTQQSLFDDNETDDGPKSILKDETLVTPEGAAYKEVPLIITKVYDDKVTSTEPKNNRSLKENVERLFHQGMQIDDIAAELSCSTSEVQFIIDML